MRFEILDIHVDLIKSYIVVTEGEIPYGKLSYYKVAQVKLFIAAIYKRISVLP